MTNPQLQPEPNRIAHQISCSFLVKSTVLLLVVWNVVSNIYSTFYVQNDQRVAAGSWIECNATRAAAFFAQHTDIWHLAQQPATGQYRRAVRHLLLLAAQVLDANDLVFWLSSGTLLGWAASCNFNLSWYRQCDVIPYSLDADIAVPARAALHHTTLIDQLEAAGLQLKMILGLSNDSYQLSFYAKDTKLDIYFFYDNADGTRWNGATKPETGEKYRYTFRPFSLCWTTFLDLRVRVPCETAAYLEDNYGTDFMSPVRSWHWQSSPPNVVPNGRWSAEEMRTAVQVYDHFDT